jgi:hypothetical protein
MATSEPGLQGDYRGSCLICFQGTDTGVVLEGEAEFIMGAMIKLGVPPNEVGPILARLDRRFRPVGKVPVGRVGFVVRICGDCFEKVGGDRTRLNLIGDQERQPASGMTGYVQPHDPDFWDRPPGKMFP